MSMSAAFRFTLALAGAALCAGANAQSVRTDAYATDSSGRIVRSGHDLCWRTSAWAPEKAIAECDPALVRRAEPAPAFKPVPVAPVTLPAPIPAPVPAPAPAPAPRVVDADSDGDGVVDRLDRCPGTRAGAKVDANGCEIPEIISLKGVTFPTGSATLTPGSSAILDEAAATLAKRGDVKVEVAGHTDNRGAAALNRSLSQRRAESVMAYLVSRGVNTANLTARGYGPDSPVADNKTESGRAANRRVELRILQQ